MCQLTNKNSFLNCILFLLEKIINNEQAKNLLQQLNEFKQKKLFSAQRLLKIKELIASAQSKSKGGNQQTINIEEKINFKQQLFSDKILHLIKNKPFQKQFIIKPFNEQIEKQINSIYTIETMNIIADFINKNNPSDKCLIDQFIENSLVNNYKTEIKTKYIALVVLIDQQFHADFKKLYLQLSPEIQLPQEDELFRIRQFKGFIQRLLYQLNSTLLQNEVLNSARTFCGQTNPSFHMDMYKYTLQTKLKKLFKLKINTIMKDITNIQEEVK